jgi:phosphatidylglycerol---prolipoprotein diacylglyceryl transferase
VEIFPILIGAGAVLGLVQVARHSPREGVLAWLDAGLLTLLGALVGARLYFVFMHLGYYRSQLLEIPQIWLGGLDWPGAIAGGLLAVVGISVARNLLLGQAADRLANLAPPLAIAAWLGCWMAGCAYGFETTAFGLRTLIEDGSFSVRFPVQILAALSLLCYYAWLEIGVSYSLPAGRRAGLIGLGLAINLLAFSFLRADPAPLWYGLRPDSWAAAVLGIIMLAVCLVSPGLFSKRVMASERRSE